MPYIGSTEKQEAILTMLSEGEDWLLDGEGEYATFVEYNAKHGELDALFRQLKTRKDEHQKRPAALLAARKKLSDIEDQTKDLPSTKSWITTNDTQRVLDLIEETREWLTNVTKDQDSKPLNEDPTFRVSEIDTRLQRVTAVYTRVSSIPKPKEIKKKKNPKNFKVENITINGKEGEDINMEDFIKYDNGDDDESDS